MKTFTLGRRWLAVCLAASFVIAVPRNATSQPSPDGAGAYASGKYRNLFAEAGRSQQEVRRKVDSAFQQLFHGNPDTQAIYYPAGTNASGPLAYITDIKHNDVRTEGLSYGMIIAAQLDRKVEFDALWNWSITYLYNADTNHFSYGFFSWQARTNGARISQFVAPDGEEYYVMALYFAANRWGNGQGIYNYKEQADQLLSRMKNRHKITSLVPWRGRGTNISVTGGPLFDVEHKMVLFTPSDERARFTDPSYHLPAFYELWARWGPQEDRQFWSDAAAVSRDFFVRVTHPVTGLNPSYANFDGSLVPSFGRYSTNFTYDAFRTAGNWSVDWSWWAKDARQRELSDKLQAFFESQGTNYGCQFTLDGKLLEDRHAEGLVAINAVASLASTNTVRAAKFVEELWNMQTPSGLERYYEGLLYMMALLHCSGEFRIWEPPVPFSVQAGQSAGKVSPMLYGLMTEEINHSYDGGLYAELIQNRAFLDSTNRPVHWLVVNCDHAAASIALDPTHPLNDKITTSLKMSVEKAAKGHPAGVANDGYWGIPVRPGTRYRVSIHARGDSSFSGPVHVSIVSEDGRTVYAKGKFSGLTTGWKKFELSLKTGRVEPTTKARFVISLEQPGTVWLGLVSLFPPTWNDRPNGLRKDLMQMLVDLNPKFLRFPGGNYLEGDTVATRFDWKKTLGPIEERPGHPCPWGYRSTDGMGLLEFLEWCEDMNAEPVLGVYAGYSLKGDYIKPGPDLDPFVQDALDEIEYVIGDTNSPWGARRAKDGHPEPFKLTYVEIGNEDFFDRSRTYDARFAQFHDAIKAKYPRLKTISSIGNEQPRSLRVHSRKPDMLDEHYYRSTDEFIRMSPDYARDYDRQGPEIFVGEWASHEDARVKPWSAAGRRQSPTPSMKTAIGDGVFMAAMERNSDLIRMQCYAPLLVNVNPGARQWRPNLIGYDALSAYGSPSYYAIKMFSHDVGDEILNVGATGTSVQGSATRDSRTGEIILKLVNARPTEQLVDIHIGGIRGVDSNGAAIILSAKPDDANFITQPRNVVPLASKLTGLKPRFAYTLPPNSIVVLKLKARS